VETCEEGTQQHSTQEKITITIAIWTILHTSYENNLSRPTSIYSITLSKREGLLEDMAKVEKEALLLVKNVGTGKYFLLRQEGIST
jgi:hypothetical protein